MPLSGRRVNAVILISPSGRKWTEGGVFLSGFPDSVVSAQTTVTKYERRRACLSHFVIGISPGDFASLSRHHGRQEEVPNELRRRSRKELLQAPPDKRGVAGRSKTGRIETANGEASATSGQSVRSTHGSFSRRQKDRDASVDHLRFASRRPGDSVCGGGEMKRLVAVLVLVSSVGVGFAANKPRETYFVYLPIMEGASVVVNMENHESRPEPVTISTFLASGKLLDETSLSLPAGGNASKTIDISGGGKTREDDLYCWLRVSGMVSTSANYESTSGDSLITLAQLPVLQSPLTDKAVKLGVMTGTRHRYTLDLQSLPESRFWVFVNLSPYSVGVDVCQSNVPNCSNPSLSRTVSPLAAIVLPIETGRRFAILESSPGFSAATAVKDSEGIRKTFQSSSSVTFDSIK